MKHNISILPLAGHYVVVAKNKETGKTEQVFNLNESGAEMLTLFKEGHDAATVARIMADRYGVNVATVENDVNSFAQSLSAKGLLYL